MAFSRLAEIVSAESSHLSVPKLSSTPYVSPGLPPLAGSAHGFDISRSGQKNFLRLSSSLQDFSAYNRLDPENGNLYSGTDWITTHAKPFSLYKQNGEGGNFSKEKALPGSPSVQKKWVPVILVFLCLQLFAFVVFTVQFFYSNWSRGSPKFYVILDCGSTGTRVYLYRASANPNKSGGLPILLSSLPEEGLLSKPNSQSGRAYNRMETEPGFDKLVHSISGLRGAIRPLLRWAEKQIPKHAHKSASLFLYATAGVRMLPSSDSKWLLNNAWAIMKNSTFLWLREWIKIISGMEEAYYGWMVLNYHTGVLGAIPKKETFAALVSGSEGGKLGM